MSYVQNNLLPNEHILLTARIHPAVFIPAVVVFLGGIAMLVFSTPTSVGGSSSTTAFFTLVIAGLLFLVAIELALEALTTKLTTEFAVTNRRIIAKRGLIRRHTLEMLLSKVETVAIFQNLVGRLLNFGTVTITGTGGTKERFNAITDPRAVRWQISQIIEDQT